MPAQRKKIILYSLTAIPITKAPKIKRESLLVNPFIEKTLQ
jgi:hypothetical protein